MNIEGSFAVVTAGKYKNQLMCIIKVVDDRKVLIADGRSCKLQKPKLKSLKHLSPIATDKTDVQTLTNKSLHRKICELLMQCF